MYQDFIRVGDILGNAVSVCITFFFFGSAYYRRKGLNFYHWAGLLLLLLAFCLSGDFTAWSWPTYGLSIFCFWLASGVERSA